MIRNVLRRTSHFLEKRSRAEDVLFSTGLLHAKLNRAVDRVQDLSQVEWRSFSQWGEDGIIDWLVHQVEEIPQSFIEFGVENYREANTRMLLRARNWRGLVMDGSKDHIFDIRSQDILWKHDLQAVHAFIDAENINDWITSHGFSGPIGILSIDIDGNDYWVWKAIHCIDPVLVVCEYNAVFGNIHPITIPYDPLFIRQKAHHSRLYYGASIAALIALAKEKGYTFLGTNSNGSSGFFIRNDKAGTILSRLAEIKSFPSRFSEARDEKDQLTFARNADRIQPIAHLPVVDVRDDRTKLLKDLGNLYDDTWLP